MNDNKIEASTSDHEEGLSKQEAEHYEHVLHERKEALVPYHNVHIVVTLVSLSFAFLAGILGSSTLWNELQGAIPKELGPDAASALTWAYPTLLFAQTLSSVLFGRLSDLVGRRWIFVFGNLIAFVGFLASSRAKEGSTITGLSILVGVGTGIQLMGPFLVLAELVPVQHRFAIVGGCMSLLAPVIAMYPAIAEALNENTGDKWRWTYSINAIFSFVAFAGLAISYHPPTYQEIHESPEAEHLKSKDWTGLMILTVSFSTFTFFCQLGDSTWAWNSAQQITLTIISGLAFVCFLIYECFFGHEHRAFPKHLISNWTILSQILIASGSSVLLWFNPLAYTIVDELIRGGSAMAQAWELSTMGAGLASGWILASVCLLRPRWIKWQLAVSVTVQAVIECVTAITKHNDRALLRALLTVSSIGQGYAMTVSHVTAGMVAPKYDLGVVVGLVTGFRNMLFAILSALFKKILLQRLASKTQSYVSEGAVQAGLLPASLPALFQALQAVEDGAPTSTLLQVPGISPQIILAAQAGSIKAAVNAWSFTVSVASIYFGGIAIMTYFSPRTDGYLSRDIWAQLKRPSRRFLRHSPGTGTNA